jgi:hypothetical protein
VAIWPNGGILFVTVEVPGTRAPFWNRSKVTLIGLVVAKGSPFLYGQRPIEVWHGREDRDGITQVSRVIGCDVTQRCIDASDTLTGNLYLSHKQVRSGCKNE